MRNQIDTTQQQHAMATAASTEKLQKIDLALANVSAYFQCLNVPFHHHCILALIMLWREFIDDHYCQVESVVASKVTADQVRTMLVSSLLGDGAKEQVQRMVSDEVRQRESGE
jgi:hypothetical protein